MLLNRAQDGADGPDDDLDALFGQVDLALVQIRAYEQTRPELYLEDEDFSEAIVLEYEDAVSDLDFAWGHVGVLLDRYDLLRRIRAEAPDAGVSDAVIDATRASATHELERAASLVQRTLEAMAAMQAMDDVCQIAASRPQDEREEYERQVRRAGKLRRTFAAIERTMPIGADEQIRAQAQRVAERMQQLLDQHPWLGDTLVKLGVGAAGAAGAGPAADLLGEALDRAGEDPAWSAIKSAAGQQIAAEYALLERQLDELGAREMFPDLRVYPLGGPDA